LNPPFQSTVPVGNDDPIRSPLDGPRSQSNNVLSGSPVTLDAGPYFASERFDDVRRMQLPFHPIVYVNRQVQMSQTERAQDDPRSFSDPRAFTSGDQLLTSQTLELGADANLFVTHSVRDSQRQSRFLNNVVDGHYGRADLSSEGDLRQLSLFREPLKGLADLLKERKKQQSTATTDVENGNRPTGEQPAGDEVPENAQQTRALPTEKVKAVARSGAPSFSEQLRSGAGRLSRAQSTNQLSNLPTVN
jgi:hypothetical protein